MKCFVTLSVLSVVWYSHAWAQKPPAASPPTPPMYLSHAGLADIRSCLFDSNRYQAIRHTVLAAGAKSLHDFLSKHYKVSAKDSVAFLFITDKEAVYKLAKDRTTSATPAEWDDSERKAVLQLLIWYKANGARFDRAERASKTATAPEAWKLFEEVARNPLVPPEDVVSMGAAIAVEFSAPARLEELAALKTLDRKTATEIQVFLTSKAELTWYRTVAEKKGRRLQASEIAWASKKFPNDWVVSETFMVAGASISTP